MFYFLVSGQLPGTDIVITFGLWSWLVALAAGGFILALTRPVKRLKAFWNRRHAAKRRYQIIRPSG